MTTTDRNAGMPTLDDAKIERLLAVCEAALPAALKALREARAELAKLNASYEIEKRQHDLSLAALRDATTMATEARALLAEARDALTCDPDCDNSDLLGKINTFLGSGR